MSAEKVWGARYTLGARYLSKNTVSFIGHIEILKVKLFYYYLPPLSIGNNISRKIKYL
jgi:hypothetical protein